MARIEFQAKIEVMDASLGSWAHVVLPKAASARVGSRGRVAVSGTINRFAFRSSAFPTGTGSHSIMVNKAMQAGAGAAIGERARFSIEVDTKPRPIVVPAELKRALAGSKAAREKFESFPPSHRREIAGYVAEAKKPETRERRAAQTVAKLASGTWKTS